MFQTIFNTTNFILFDDGGLEFEYISGGEDSKSNADITFNVEDDEKDYKTDKSNPNKR